MMDDDRRLIETLIVEIRALREAMCRKPDPFKPAALLAAIAECAGDREFTTGVLVRHGPFVPPDVEIALSGAMMLAVKTNYRGHKKRQAGKAVSSISPLPRPRTL